jgi:Fe-S-cluster-containing dehydrogenase component
MKYAFVIDQRKCIGCHACTVACKAEHDVPIIAALGDLKRLAEHRDRVVMAVLGKERKAQSWLREKMPSAFFRISCS